jgi:putative ABC transport system permease protein
MFGTGHPLDRVDVGIQANPRDTRSGAGGSAFATAGRMVSAFLQDLRFAFRLLRRSPRETIVATAIFGAGIGANTAMFSALDHVLWRPFPFKDEATLVRLREEVTAADGAAHPFNMSSEAILAVRSGATDVFDEVVAMSGQNMTLAGADGGERVSVVLQTDGFDNTLGVRPIVGRALAADEYRRGIDAGVALVSHATWETRFGRSAAAIGSRVRLDGRAFTIVGVMPPQYAFPYDAQFWVPWQLDPADRTRDFAVWARLRPGATPRQIRGAADRIAAQLRHDRPDLPSGYGLEIRSLRENLLGAEDRPLLAVTEVVGFMLLIAAVNVATVLLARAVARRREFAVRAAIGQSRRRLLAQLLAEAAALASLGCGAGLLLAAWLAPLTASFVPRVLSGQLGLVSPRTDWRVAVFAAAASMASAIVAGVLPGLATLRTDPPLAPGGRTMSDGRTSRRLLGALIVAETALTLVLLAAAGLVIRNFVALRTQPLGFDARGLLAIEITPPPAAYGDGERRAALIRQLVEQVSAVPGVVRSGVTTVNPLGGGTWGAAIVSEEMAARDPRAALNVNHRLITPGLLETMGTPIVGGRDFSSGDRIDTQPVVIVSERLARRLWPAGEALGRRVRTLRSGSPWLTVVGVAGNVSDSHDPGVPAETWYVPYAQQADSAAAEHVYMMVRDGAQPLALVGDVRRAIARVDRALAPYDPVAMDAYWTGSIARERVSAAFMIGFGAFGLLLASLGIYGVMTLSVAQRRIEFGIRMALGARPSDVLRLILRRSLALVGAGIAIGFVFASALGRVIAGLLTSAGGIDPAMLAVAGLLILATASVACLLPALAAQRVDLVAALND